MAKSTNYYRAQCKEYGWEPGPDDIIYRANMLLAETDDEADEQLKKQAGAAPFPMRPALREAMIEADKRNIAGEARQANVGGVLPTTFIGGPDTIVEQIRQMPRGGRRRRARPVADQPRLGRSRRADGRARAVRQDRAAAHQGDLARS